MSETRLCPDCGMELAPGAAPAALCPRCLLAAGAADDLSDAEILEGLVGRTIDGKYRVDRPLGRGGMGAVYLATHVGTERPVALKVLAPALMDDEEFVERFRREARAAGRLRHPNIVNVTDFGFADLGDEGVLAYLVMEYLDGCSLAEYLADGYERPVEWVADVVEQIALAVDEAHRHGVIHRDLKPANIWLVPDGRGGHIVKVLDFGLAKLRDMQEPPLPLASDAPPSDDEAPTLALPSTAAPPVRRASGFGAWRTAARITGVGRGALTIAGGPPSEVEGLTRVGSVLGTPLYMSPEQCQGEKLDGRSDVYSLGVIAFELLTGIRPFVGDTKTLVAHHAFREPPRPSSFRAALPESIDDVLLSTLAKSPAARPESASAFAQSLKGSIGTLVEDPRSALGRAVTIYGEQPSLFVSLSALSGLIPFAAGLAFAMRWYPSGAIGLAGAVLVAYGAWLLGGLVNAGVVTPLVAHALDRPLERVSWGALRRNLARRAARFAVASHVMPWNVALSLVALIGSTIVAPYLIDSTVWRVVLFATLVGVLGDGTAYSGLGGIVALLEPLPLRAIPARARQLERRLRDARSVFVGKRSAASVAAVAGVIVACQVLPADLASEAGQFALASALLALGGSLLMNPIAAIRVGLRYVQARRLGGEPLGAVTTQFAMPSEPRRAALARGDVPVRVEAQPDWARIVINSSLVALPSAAAQGLGIVSGHFSNVITFLSILVISTLLQARAASKVAITRDSIFMPKVSGEGVIRWAEVTKAQRDGRSIIIRAGRKKMVFTPSSYRNAGEVGDYVLGRLREHGKIL